ncbi:hypothetical protein [Rhodoferax sp.]|uniref:hypothetical protein n=1 Tax=Rhodoferax sp. TaxID=50421 RepID=UPI002849C5CB|nr:hypothetical protein [Rhodoferax sp.]MDR3368503.1 hypothetical protein [Rhodoferax sp.]
MIEAFIFLCELCVTLMLLLAEKKASDKNSNTQDLGLFKYRESLTSINVAAKEQARKSNA